MVRKDHLCFITDITGTKDSPQKPAVLNGEIATENKPQLKKVKQSQISESPLDKLKRLENGMHNVLVGFLQFAN